MKYALVLLISLLTATIELLSQTDARVSTEIVEFQGNINEAIKNQIDVPPGQTWLIYNTSTQQFEFANDDDIWKSFGSADDTNYFFVPETANDLVDPANANTVAFIIHDLNLNSSAIQLAEGVSIKAGGGIISNGTLIGNNSTIDESVAEQIFETNVSFAGTWNENLWFQPEWYGSNIMVDDYEALKATFTNWDKIHLPGQYEYNTDAQIFIDGVSREVKIKGEGKIENNSSTHITQPMFEVRSIRKLDIHRLQIDGKFKANCALYLRSCPVYTISNLDIQNFKNSGTGFNRAVGVRLDINHATQLKGENWVIKEFDGGSDGTINSGLGVARCLWILINYTQISDNEETHIEINNSKFHWTYGDDGDLLDIADQNYINTPGHRFIFRNSEFKYFSRRASKGSAGGIQFYNCTFDTADEATLTNKMGGISPMPSGYLNIRNANPINHPNYRNSFAAVVACTFNNTGNLTLGSGNRIIIQNVKGVLLDSNVFNETGITLSENISGLRIENNLFNNGNIDIWANAFWEEDRSIIAENTMDLKAGYTVLAFINTSSSGNGILRNLDVVSNNLFIDENNTVNCFGIIRHLAGTASDVHVINNKLFRKNHVRTEIMISLAQWDNSCRIENNACNLVSGIGINFNPISNNQAITFNNSYNLIGGAIPPLAIFR